MLNRAPIFINGFSFGGTNLIMNLFVSHPGVCMLSGETHEVFYSKPTKALDKAVRRLFYLPVQAAAGREVFWKNNYEERRRVPGALRRYIDLVFYVDKMTTERNEFKSEGARHTIGEKHRARFLAKSVNGVAFASDIFAEMYPDATFVALVRNGVALCEGYVRRGRAAGDFGDVYERVCQKMLRDSERIPNYHIVRFEDMVSEPLEFMKRIYGYADLDISAVSKVRLQAKKAMEKDGSRRYAFGGEKDREIHWFRLDELGKHIRGDIDENQMLQLSDADRGAFLAKAENSMRALGYI